jgi:hypothetical protein
MSSASTWNEIFQDSGLIFLTLTCLGLSLAMMGVPFLAALLGLNGQTSWHSAVASLVILGVAGYVLSPITSDVVNQERRILRSPVNDTYKVVVGGVGLWLACAGILYFRYNGGTGSGL